MKALIEQETEEEEHETFDYKETAAATTGLGDLLKGLEAVERGRDVSNPQNKRSGRSVAVRDVSV